jgi:hypothetical protein
VTRLRGFAAFCYDFFVGDDWRLAAGVVLGLSLLSLLVHAFHGQQWWLLPAVVAITLVASLTHATRSR